MKGVVGGLASPELPDRPFHNFFEPKHQDIGEVRERCSTNFEAGKL